MATRTRGQQDLLVRLLLLHREGSWSGEDEGKLETATGAH